MSAPQGMHPSRRPGVAQHPLAQALQLEASGMIGEAERALRQIVHARPREAMAWAALGRVLMKKREFAPAEEALQKALKLNPRDAESSLVLGMLYQHAGRPEDSLLCCERAIWAAPGDERAYCAKAALQEMQRDIPQSLATIEACMKSAKRVSLARVIRARALRRVGRMDEARAEAEAVIADESAAVDVRRRAAYELARILDKSGDYAGAFAAATRANALQHEDPDAKRVYSTGWFPFAQRLMSVGAERMKPWADRRYADNLPAPLFLMGFPRSGTTMLEQILASHPSVAVSNERDMLSPACAELFRGVQESADMGAALDAIETPRVLAARRVYHQISERMRAEKPGATVVLDKYPMNLFLVSVINLVFPESRIIAAHRDPRDVCLSCYLQEFVANTPMVHFLTLDDTARLYELIMGGWSAQRPGLSIPVLDVRYETLTTSLEPEARRILEFCGVPWDDAVLHFHEREHQRWVTTPSYESISKPVNTDAHGRWKRYRAQMAPILPRLEPFVKAMGYPPSDAS